MKRIDRVPESDRDIIGLLTFSLLEVKLRIELVRRAATVGRPLTSQEEDSIVSTIEGMRDSYAEMALKRVIENNLSISWKSFGFNVLCGALGNLAFGIAAIVLWAVFHLPSLKAFFSNLIN
jgi:hypothetical protein